MAKIMIKLSSTTAETFNDFLLAEKAKGLSEKTLATYSQHFAAIGKLYQHCAEVEAQARDMFDVLVEQMKEAEGVTEQLKEGNQL